LKAIQTTVSMPETVGTLLGLALALPRYLQSLDMPVEIHAMQCNPLQFIFKVLPYDENNAVKDAKFRL